MNYMQCHSHATLYDKHLYNNNKPVGNSTQAQALDWVTNFLYEHESLLAQQAS